MSSLIVPSGVVYRDEAEKVALESRNGYLQGWFVRDVLRHWRDGSDSGYTANQLTPELLRELQRIAINQLYRCAGFFRNGPVTIGGVDHQPPDHQDVPGLVDEMCSYVNKNWGQATAVHVASYVMWRMNWIHPFFGGNGRTARAASYLVLCGVLGTDLPGEKTIPELIVGRRRPYLDALRKADEAWSGGQIDVSAMEDLVSALLAQQLLAVHEIATGARAGQESA